MNLTWEGLLKLGYKLEVSDPAKRGKKWRRIYELGGLHVCLNNGWPIRLAKGQV